MHFLLKCRSRIQDTHLSSKKYKLYVYIYIYIYRLRTHLWKLFLFRTFCTHSQSCLLTLHGHTNNSNALFLRSLYHENYNTSMGHMKLVDYNYRKVERKTFGLSGRTYGVCHRGLQLFSETWTCIRNVKHSFYVYNKYYFHSNLYNYKY